MSKIHILIEGYAHPGENGLYIASPTTSLIYSNGLKILVDPGTNSKALIEALKEHNLTVKDIDRLFISHYHPDHFLNVRLFGQVDLYDGSMKWSEDKEEMYQDVFIPGTDIKIIPTPGHSPEHSSLLVQDEELGAVCVAQDVFWWEDGKQDNSSVEVLMNLTDQYMTGLEMLKSSRKKVLEISDWIIPGHGKMFKNPSRLA